MRKGKKPEELSEEELRQLLLEKKRQASLKRQEQFQEKGRVVYLTAERESDSINHLHSDAQADGEFGEENVGRKKRIKPFLDRFLFIVEILAVIGLVLVGYYGYQMLHNLNKEYSSVLTPPTLTPTPLIVAVILPSGHTPPNSPGGAQPNMGEIPAHLLPLYQTMAEIPIPTPGPEQATQIQIPAIDVDAPIVQGDGWEQLKQGVAQHVGSADPGQMGNMVLSAHNDVFGEIFRDLDKLEQGDTVLIFTANYSFTYVVTETKIVAPTDVEVMAATPDSVLTLISCYPYMVDSKRIVVQASLQSSEK